MPLPFLISLIRFLWIPVALVTVLAATQRQWWLMVAGLSLALLLTLWRLPYYGHAIPRGHAIRHGHRDPNTRQTNRENAGWSASADDGAAADADMNTRVRTSRPVASLHVMTLNCRYGHADAAQIVQMVTDHDVDVLALQELTEELVGRLRAAGLHEALSYRQLGEPGAQDNGGFNGIWSRRRPRRRVANSIAMPAAQIPAIVLRLDPTSQAGSTHEPRPVAHDLTITLASAHPKSPMRGCRQWSEGILALRAFARRGAVEAHDRIGHVPGIDRIPGAEDPDRTTPGALTGTTDSGDTIETRTTINTRTTIDADASENREVIVMGDLNSNLDHPSFRTLLRAGFHDAGLDRGRGPLHTFPTWLRWPGLDLDHVLLSDGLRASELTTTRIDGSDHMALRATITAIGQPSSSADASGSIK